MLFDGSYASAMRCKAATDINLTRRASWLDAQPDCGECRHHAFDQRLARTTESLDATPYSDIADRLTDLNADRAVPMRHDAVKLGAMHCPCVDIEPTRALTKCLDWSVDSQVVYRAKVDEADPTGPM